MSKFIFLVQVFLLPVVSYPARIASKNDLTTVYITIAAPCANSQNNLDWLIKLKYSEYKRITGVKLPLTKRLGLKIIQARIKKSVRKASFSGLSFDQNPSGKKPDILIALLIVLGITILFLSLAFLLFSGVDW